MRYIDILAKFLDLFPNYINKVTVWGPCGENCIKVVLNDRSELKFVYFDDHKWTLETA